MPENITVISSGPLGSFESFLDTVANYLANPPVFTGQADTTVIHWVIGDIGMGEVPGLPVGFISPLNDLILPYGGGRTPGGRRGVDFDEYTVPLLIVESEHNYEPPVPVSTTDAPNAANYSEHPGYRKLMRLAQNVRSALRIESSFGGAVATSTISELRPMLIDLDNKVYRGARLTIAARSRRSRA